MSTEPKWKVWVSAAGDCYATSGVKDMDYRCRSHEAAQNLCDLLNAQEWQPIETAPKDGRRIIVTGEGGHVWCDVHWVRRQRAGERWESFLGPVPFRPTLWKPRPQPPEAP